MIYYKFYGKHLFFRDFGNFLLKGGWVARSAPPQRPQRKGLPTGGKEKKDASNAIRDFIYLDYSRVKITGIFYE
ncbi:hypothetical protein AMJ44_04575 [candidate division WOR-1 bacterium DG_54_3]|uniref:Uncharacterized protein n=1 Tax=candidate division WOR-1 bacterium DG_54_3 TaxID=1703775 RepID=A0A0S7Y305_UNCSA|nr:MAG: hypothetical protein AMJ44_04575 [candidate division WOR-1 bacterium DG_54_3]